MRHVCSDSGGAHHYHADSNGIRMCSCGEMEISPEEELELAEMAVPDPSQPRMSRERRASLYGKIFGVMRKHGYDAPDLDEFLDRQDEDYGREA